MSSRVLGVIPARLASSRLPEKPLQPLLGRPLIEWVWRRVRAMSVLDRVVVATDSPRIAEICESMGAPVELTDPRHPSGTDRVAEVAGRHPYREYDVIVNVQGDEPLLRAEHVASVVELVREGGWGIGTCASPILDLDVWRDPSAVKVVRAGDGRALYFSRGPIPWKREGDPTREELGAAPFLRHIGLYAYGREALLRWVALEPSALERLERLEQLRPLEVGMEIGVAVVRAAEGGVDTPADVVRTERRLREMGHREHSADAGERSDRSQDPPGPVDDERP